MKRLIIAISLAVMFAGGVMAVEPNQDLPPVYRAQLLGYAYLQLCEGPLGGTYVNSNPNFYQAWACEEIDWCEVRPETFGCVRPEQR